MESVSSHSETNRRLSFSCYVSFKTIRAAVLSTNVKKAMVLLPLTSQNAQLKLPLSPSKQPGPVSHPTSSQ